MKFHGNQEALSRRHRAFAVGVLWWHNFGSFETASSQQPSNRAANGPKKLNSSQNKCQWQNLKWIFGKRFSKVVSQRESWASASAFEVHWAHSSTKIHTAELRPIHLCSLQTEINGIYMGSEQHMTRTIQESLLQAAVQSAYPMHSTEVQ
jgi:hypothetical protein